MLTPPEPALAEAAAQALDLTDIKGQESAKRAIEVTAAGDHNLLIPGPPDKSNERRLRGSEFSSSSTMFVFAIANESVSR